MSVQDQLLDRIEALSVSSDMSIVLNDAEKKQVNEQLDNITQQAQAIENVDDRISFLINQLRNQLESACESKRSTIHYKQRIERLTKEKSTLESLSKKLSTQNNQHKSDLIKHQQTSQQSLSDLRNKFEASLTSIQEQLSVHNAERESQAAAQTAMKQHIDKMVEFDQARAEHDERVVKTKDLTLSIKDNEIKQLQMKAMQSEVDAKELKNQLIEMLNANKVLTEQVGTYAQKFSEVESMMTQSNKLFNDTKQQLSLMQKQTLKAEKAKLVEMEKNNANGAALIKLVQDKKELNEQLIRSERQKNALQSLCKQLQSQIKAKDTSSTTSTGDDGLITLTDDTPIPTT